MTTYDRIKKLCDDNDKMAVTALEKELGFGRGSIGKMKNGGKTNEERIKKIADYFGVTTDYLINGEEQPLPKDAIPYEPVPTILVPLVGVVNCGTPLFAEDNIEDHIPTPAAEVLTGETYFWLRAKGDSMINVGIREGDLLFIRKQSDVDSGDIAVVSVDGDEATLKRVIKKENALILQPENPSHETKIFVGEEINSICIKGRLMESKKKF